MICWTRLHTVVVFLASTPVFGHVPVTNSKPVIDGRLDDSCWKHAARTGPLKVALRWMAVLSILVVVSGCERKSNNIGTQSARSESKTTTESVSPLVQTLINQLKNGIPREKVSAADQLVHMGEAAKPAIQPMLEAMTGKSAWVDMAMMNTLSEMAAVSFPILIDKYQNADLETRLSVARVFWYMGAKAKEARPIILKGAQDKEKRLSDLANLVLKKMDAEIAEENVAAVQSSSSTQPVISTLATPAAKKTDTRLAGVPRR